MIKRPLPKNCYSKYPILTPEGIIIHYISAINTAPDAWDDVDEIVKIFEDYKLSAHFLIDRYGNVIELVPINFRAFHAGKSKWKKWRNLNRNFLGIELVATHNSGYTDAQYDALQKLCTNLTNELNISMSNVVGHSDVAPRRKRDPGPLFDWDRFREGGK